jgi:asparagine synthase (glutamine-hydrolysing)
MCGIFGFIDPDQKQNNYDILKSITSILLHRGPDNMGFWQDEKKLVNLGHTRLSILDLKETGNQPMISKDERYVIIYNGEIYNHLDLRKKLFKDIELKSFSSSSDTETLLKIIETKGLYEAIKKIDGMFAFVLYDKLKKKIFLARDKFGEKPLYVGLIKNKIVFGSELKVFKKFPEFKNKICNEAVNLFFKYSYIPQPYSIYKNIYKIPSGSILEINLQDIKIEDNKFFHFFNKNIYKWFNYEGYINNNLKYKNLKNIDLLVNDFDILFNNKIKEYLNSDVETGTFLSGGIDSSLVTSIASKYKKNLKTFTVGFNVTDYDESKFAKKISKELNTDHHEIILDNKDFNNVLPKIIDIYDEPFADSSQIPTFLISQFSSKKTKVILSGDGGDEIFCGYNRYFYIEELWKKFSILDYSSRNKLFKLVSLLPTNILEKLLKFVYKIVYRSKKIPGNNSFIKILKRFGNVKNIDELYESFLCCDWDSQYSRILNINYDKNIMSFEKKKIFKNSFIKNMMYWDTQNYLTDDILCKVDRASMFNSLETRHPFLSNEVVEFAINLDEKYLYNKNKEGKLILRNTLSKYLPKDLINREKMGFGIPIDDWFRNNLKEELQNLISDNINFPEFLNKGLITNFLFKHLKKNGNFGRELWNIYIFLKWYKRHKNEN